MITQDPNENCEWMVIILAKMGDKSWGSIVAYGNTMHEILDFIKEEHDSINSIDTVKIFRRTYGK